MRARYFAEDESIPGVYGLSPVWVIAAIPIEYEFDNERRLIEMAKAGSITPAWTGEKDMGAFLPETNPNSHMSWFW